MSPLEAVFCEANRPVGPRLLLLPLSESVFTLVRRLGDLVVNTNFTAPAKIVCALPPFQW